MFDLLPSALPRAALQGAPAGGPADLGAADFADAQLGAAAVTAATDAGSLSGDSAQDFGGGTLLAEADLDASGAADEQAEESTEVIDRPRKHAARLFSDLWRAQIDPENLQIFTEIVNPFTRSTMYRLPPLELSEQAVVESLAASKKEYMQLSIGGEI